MSPPEFWGGDIITLTQFYKMYESFFVKPSLWSSFGDFSEDLKFLILCKHRLPSRTTDNVQLSFFLARQLLEIWINKSGRANDIEIIKA